MGLDAVVCCNCEENRNFKTAPNPEWEIYTDSNGYVECEIEDLKLQLEYDMWRMSKACEHEDCILIHHYLGNSARNVIELRNNPKGI